MSETMSVNLNDLKARIEAADVYALAKRTPCELAPKLSAEFGRNIWMKREDLQDVFSFKIRGAANRIASLSDAERARGVCAASAGNHAQGMAAAARYYKTKAVIFMPVTTPAIKVEAVSARGAEPRLVGESYDEACAAAIEYSEQSGAVFIHPFDEIDVIAGQGTVGKEIMEQMPRTPAAIYVCTGGGGLVSGVGTWVKAVSPNTQIIAVEPEGAATLKVSMDAGTPTPLNMVDGFADGVAVKLIGTNTLDIAARVVDRNLLVSNDEICAAVKDVFEATRTVVEPAGALALAGVLREIREGRAPEGDLVVTISGANVNFDRIGHIVERAELGAGEEMLSESDEAHVLVGVKTKTSEEHADIIAAMAAEGITVTDMSLNRLAKRHLRHMVGGRASADIPEVIYQFEFPERPGALRDFLVNLDSRWNISLFHYRNHGNSAGHVLCGFQVPNGDVEALEESLNKTGYPMERETDNAAYLDFLKA